MYPETVESMGTIGFEIVERHPYFLVVAVFESDERMDVIGLKSERDAKIILDKLKIIFRNCVRKSRKKNILPARFEGVGG